MNNFVSSEKKEIILPDLPAELLRDQYRHETFTTSSIPSFCSTTEAQVTEKLNSNPYLLRSTLYLLPINSYYLEISKLPFALCVTPFSTRGHYTTVNGQDNCIQCRASLFYNISNNITNFVNDTVLNNNNSFTKYNLTDNFCSICGYKNSFPLQYPENRNLISIEQILYHDVRLSPGFVFVFDSSFSGLLDIIDIIPNLCAMPEFQSLYSHVVFVLIDSSDIVFFSNKKNKQNDKFENSFTDKQTTLITPILFRIFGILPVPELPDTIAISSKDSITISHICNFIKKIHTVKTDKILHVAVLELLKKLSQLFSGATVTYFLNTLLDQFNYEEFIKATKCISMNFFIENRNNATGLAKLAFHTGGRIILDNYLANLRNIALLRTAYDVTLVLKVSGNIIKKAVIAHDLTENLVCTYLPSMNSSHAVTFLLGLEGISKVDKYAQIIVTGTDGDGVRRVRVLKQTFSVCDGLEIYSGVSFDTIFTILIKLWIIDFIDVEEHFIRILLFYRNRCSSSHSVTQFILPDLLKPLPVLIQAFMKRIGSNEKTEIISSMRIDKSGIVVSGVEDIVRLFYPRLFSLSDYSLLVQTHGICLTASNICHEEIYVMENGINIFVYLGKDIDSALFEDICLKDIFNNDSKVNLKNNKIIDNNKYFYLNTTEYKIRNDTETGYLLLKAIDEINIHYNRILPIQVISSGSIEEIKFLSFMVEDKFEYKPSYADFIYKTHIKVHKLLSLKK